MDIYQRLMRDHDKQRRLCRRLKETEGDSEDRRRSWDALKVELEAHAAAEEQTFYAELMKSPDATERARHSVHEHQEITELVEELEGTDMSSPHWISTLKKLAEKTVHHIDEEEEVVFPLARKLIDENRATELRTAFNERKPEEVRREREDAA